MSTPMIEIGDATSRGGGAAAIAGPWSIGQDLASLIANSSAGISASGTKIIKLDAGSLSLCSPLQVGNVKDGVTCTAAMVAANQALLNQLGAYCRANGISVRIEAALSVDKNWDYLWLPYVVQAGIPVDGVENDDEIAYNGQGNATTYAHYASNIVTAMKEIIKYYPNVKLGSWEAGGPVNWTAQWLAAYNTAAVAAGIPKMSYFVADTTQSPWVKGSSPADWANWMTNLSALAAQNGMGLTAFASGQDTSGSNRQWTAGAEQYAAALAQLPVNIDVMMIRTWGQSYPDAILPINSPTTMANAATEIGATYALYQAGKISANGVIGITAAGQLVTTVGTAAGSPVTLNFDSTLNSQRIAVVILDNVGTFTATPSGTSTVTGAGTNKLVLNGTVTEVAATLKTLRVTQTVAGPDSIDVEVFGAKGRMADTQIAVVASNAGNYNFLPTAIGQDWASASATVNGGIATNMHFVWNPAGVDAAGYHVIHTLSIHEPLVQHSIWGNEPGLVLVNGVLEQAGINKTATTPGSLALNSGFAFNAYYSPGHFSTVNILTTDMTFDPATGKLLTITDKLAADTPTATTPGSPPNYFATGATQITQYNTGNNPNWKPEWKSFLGSVSTIYGSSGQILESIYRGDANHQGFILDNVFNPYTGALWEQFETQPPPSPYQYAANGTQLITEFNTGDNPNWNYASYGSNAHVTIKWQDYYPVSVLATAPVPVGATTTDAYAPVVVTPPPPPPPPPPPAELVQNWSFENGQTTTGGAWASFGSLPGWTTDAGSHALEVVSRGLWNVMGDGHWLDSQASPGGIDISQVIGLNVGQHAQMAFSISAEGAFAYGLTTDPNEKLDLMFGGTLMKEVTLADFGNDFSSFHTFSANIVGGADNTLRIVSYGSNSPGIGFAIDSVSIKALVNGDELVQNASFEAGQTTTGGAWTSFTSLTGWTTDAGSHGLEVVSRGLYNIMGDGHWLDSQASPGGIDISQVISGLTAGQHAQMTFTVAAEGAFMNTSPNEKLDFMFGGTLVKEVTMADFATPGGSDFSSFRTFSANIVGGADNTLRIVSYGSDNPGIGFAIDAVSIKAT